MQSETSEISVSIPKMIREGQRLRSDLARNIATLRVTLQQSKTIASKCGWEREVRLDPAPTPESVLLARLTPRELEVLRLIAEGKSTKQAAATLGIAFRTAVCHRYRIFQKLRIHETASLVRLAVRAGLVSA